ncbi:pyruvate, phosphate dikinase [Irregularibacter muris]|uniref:Pyruvate, phosphate dikinase n=1 Tax=Irregularibacter muris TaxID=1796619 RepID=A0AAE3KYZ2_9FIRM|nr:pyruvate, phosphate dikinase [Irregularibacter muris]MCR1897871.1 pyruvate, phosphate dikinase [Irregularibacter muris]
MKKYVYMFQEGNSKMKDLLGGKGANLAEMTRIGLPVPQGFTISTQACNLFYEKGEKLTEEIKEEIYTYLSQLEQETGKTFGSKENPLLVSVRSGAAISMPGMMDTILNLGLNDDTVLALAEKTQNERFAYDSYRRFIQMFSDVVLSIPKYKFDHILERVKEENNFMEDTQLTAEHLKEIVKEYKKIVKSEVRRAFPQEPREQLLMAVEAVFASWNNPRAIAYRRYNEIPHEIGTAVNVQSMVFGNMGNDCGTGVAFTRNPSTGEKKLFGEFLLNAQGEDVVAGIRTPKTISQLQQLMPEVYDQFIKTTEILEKHYRDMQDIEFTIEESKLFILQTRSGKRTAEAAMRVAVELVEEGLISKEEAILRIDAKQLDQLLHPTFEPRALEAAQMLAQGLPASPGAARGKIYFTAEKIIEAANNGEKTILVRQETSPEDIEGMYAAQGILTARGGMTSHAAVVARGMGKCCVAGCETIKVNEQKREFVIEGRVFTEGDFISLDGSTGKVYRGDIATIEPTLSGSFGELMQWADEIRSLLVRTNADTPADARTAVKFGAQGIGLCRTEHMFFDESRILSVRKMIFAKTTEQREKALEELLPVQREDFEGIYEAMGERPVTIRLLDPPLHEFLPHSGKEMQDLANNLEISLEEVKEIAESLKEFNPMLGHRGCRLAITYPEITIMQTKAIIQAAIAVSKKNNITIKPEIMVPLIGTVKELKYLKDVIHETAREIIKEAEVDLDYLVGTMIEVPRATLTADEIAQEADFFSFGTNDLTQMTFGFSRDDAGKFLKEYVEKDILEQDPFQSIDQEGVGKLVEMAVELGRKVKPDLKIGICGEHGGDPESIKFFHKTGLSYVSCSPYRVPIARLSAAQAQILNKR